jgi:hypothetical protein
MNTRSPPDQRRAAFRSVGRCARITSRATDAQESRVIQKRVAPADHFFDHAAAGVGHEAGPPKTRWGRNAEKQPAASTSTALCFPQAEDRIDGWNISRAPEPAAWLSSANAEPASGSLKSGRRPNSESLNTA